ncbi:hypothetical protein FA13DRAFT_840920 [Coprinellus micaceus]|uniref:Uncharacterized protein n=1 Tax=Coprinellus micaceus TaxID=71717 RepID=A0A4Y7T153_COPMI|nr:hypothetical protein FA13DRAFT_840920 [Coprinellus micaceus]
MGPPPEVPTEIWLQIFRLASEDRGSSLESLRVGPNDRRLGREESVGYKKSLATKLSLVGTCRRWNIIATPLLYEHISVTGQRRYSRVLGGFNRDDGASAKYRNMVTRLDLVCLEEGRGYKIAIELCRAFPELTTLLAALAFTKEDEPTPLFDELSPKLKHLYLLPGSSSMWMLKRVPFSRMVDFLDNHPQLLDISTPYAFSEPESSEERRDWSGKSWPTIRTLVLQNRNQAEVLSACLPSEAFPNLQFVNGLSFGKDVQKSYRNTLAQDW